MVAAGSEDARARRNGGSAATQSGHHGLPAESLDAKSSTAHDFPYFWWMAANVASLDCTKQSDVSTIQRPPLLAAAVGAAFGTDVDLLTSFKRRAAKSMTSEYFTAMRKFLSLDVWMSFRNCSRGESVLDAASADVSIAESFVRLNGGAACIDDRPARQKHRAVGQARAVKLICLQNSTRPGFCSVRKMYCRFS